MRNGTTLRGGAGGAGGAGDSFEGGGGGGAGAYGAVLTDSRGASLNSGLLQGGTGGAGGVGQNTDNPTGAGGGTGGIGAQFLGTRVTLSNEGSGAIAGGTGGAGGQTPASLVGPGGNGGIGVQFLAGGASLTNATSASISGGGGGTGGGSGGNAVQFAGPGSLTNSGVITGGAGGGAAGIALGIGGAGVSLTAGGSVVNNFGATISGGAGGARQFQGPPTNGGGAGILADGATIFNAGAIIGGAAGNSGSGLPAIGGSAIVGANLTVVNAGVLQGGSSGSLGIANAVLFTGGVNVFQVQPDSGVTGNVQAYGSADTLQLGGTSAGRFNVGQIGGAGTPNGQPGQFVGFGAFSMVGSGTWTLIGTPQQTTAWSLNAGTVAIFSDLSLGGSNETVTFNGGTLQALQPLASTRPIVLGAGGGTIDTNGYTVTLAGNISGASVLTKQGPGTLILQGNNGIAGAVVSAGTLQGSATTLPGSILNNGSVSFNQTAAGTYAGTISGTGAVAIGGGGVLTLTGNQTYAGPTTLSGTTLVVNGSLASSVTADGGSTIGGNGSIGGLTALGARLRPGNSIGTLTVTGTLVQSGGTYQVEVNSQGQNDRINVAGTATLNGGTVQVMPVDQGSYTRSVTYTILNAAGGLSGAYSGVAHDFAFLTPTLSYDASNAYLTLALVGQAPFSSGAATPNQRAAGSGLDRIHATATGDMATVVGALAGLSVSQGQQALDAVSGQPWADMATVNVSAATMFMDALGQQMALARGAGGTGTRQALAQVCEIAACEASSPFTVWGSLLGGAGSVTGNGNAATVTYNQGGAAAGIDYRIDPRLLVGVGVGYGAGSMWVSNFAGVGWTSSVTAAAYASFAPALRATLR